MRIISQFRESFASSTPGWGDSAADTAFRRSLLKGKTVAAMVAVVLVAAVIGYLSPGLSIVTPVALLVVGALLLLVSRRPTWSVVLLLILTSTLFSPDFFGNWIQVNTAFLIYELLLILIVGRALLAGGKPGVFERISGSPVAITLIVFAAIVAAKSLVIMIEGRFASGVLNSIYLFDRSLSLYLLFIPVLIFFKTVKSQRWLAGAMFCLAAVAAASVVLQIIYPENGLFSQFTSAQSLQSDTPTVDPFVQRLRPPGGTLVLVCFWMGMMNLVLRPWNWKRVTLYIPLTLLMLTGVLMEFNRSYVVPIVLLLGLTLLLNRKNVRLKLLAVLAVTATIFIIFSSATGTLENYVSAAAIRYGSTFSSESLEAQSQTSRQIEDNYAWIAIRGAPAFGIALDELYRPPVPGMYDNLRWYIHDSYIWIWTYFGLAGLAAFVAVVATALFRGMFNWGKIRDPFLQAGVLGMTFALITLVVANFAAPKFYEYETVPVVALVFGLIEAIVISNNKPEPEEETGSGDRP